MRYQLIDSFDDETFYFKDKKDLSDHLSHHNNLDDEQIELLIEEGWFERSWCSLFLDDLTKDKLYIDDYKK